MESGYISGIPIRNLWLLMLYASDLFREAANREKVTVEDNPDDIPDLVAEILARIVERRLRRNLTFGYRQEKAVIGRVRGRINLLQTERQQLLARGRIACTFDDLTVNTARNRFVRAALESIAGIVRRSELARRCRSLSASLRGLGVSVEVPTRTEVSTDRYGLHDEGDRYMVSAARLAFDLALPTENEGTAFMVRPDRDVTWIRHLFEKAVGGFYSFVLSPVGWHVQTGTSFGWLIENQTAGIARILPSMRTDVILDHLSTSRRIVIDTKFTSVTTRGLFRDEVLKSGYLYQMYAYLRSQEGGGHPLADRAAGLFIHPSIGEMVDETVVIQNHPIRFATIDLADSASHIREQLLRLVDFPFDDVVVRP